MSKYWGSCSTLIQVMAWYLFLGSFSACTQPMRDSVILQCRLSLAGHIRKFIPVIPIIWCHAITWINPCASKFFTILKLMEERNFKAIIIVIVKISFCHRILLSYLYNENSWWEFHQPRLVIRTFHHQGRCSRGGHLCNEHSEEEYSCSYK